MSEHLYFNPVDHAALNRVVDEDGSRNGTAGVYLHADEAVKPTFVRVSDESDDAEDALFNGEVWEFDPLTAALITLSHNAAGDLEATKPWARQEDGTNLLDTPEGKAAWDHYVGIGLPDIWQIAITHVKHAMLTTALEQGIEIITIDNDDDIEHELGGEG